MPESTAGWIGLSARLQRVAAGRSGRTDLVLRVDPALGPDPLAWSGWYRHDLAEIRLPATVTDAADPERVDVTTGAGRRTQPRLAGALTLACAHATHTTWSRPADVDAVIAVALDLLELVRVVRGLVAERPADRPWIRAIAPILVARFDDRGPLWPLVAMLGLGPIGGLDEARSAPVRAQLRTRLGVEGLGVVEDVLRTAAGLPDGAVDALWVQADRLTARLGRLGDSTETPDDQCGYELRQGVERPDAEVDDGLAARPLRPREEELRLAEQELARAASDAVFDRDGSPGNAEREPTPELRQSARALATALRRARFRAPALTLVPSASPPGRLRLAEAVRREAQRAAGAEITARPWRQARRRAVDQPPLRVGLSWDVSRSRSDLHARMADLAWALSWALHHVAGELAAVAWSSRVSAVQWPGRTPERVVEPPCGGRSSGCPQSLRALAGVLALHEPRGARVVIVVTDGRVPNRRAIAAEACRLSRDGVDVLWVTPAVDPSAPAGVVPVVLADPDTLIATLGDRIGRLLARSRA